MARLRRYNGQTMAIDSCVRNELFGVQMMNKIGRRLNLQKKNNSPTLHPLVLYFSQVYNISQRSVPRYPTTAANGTQSCHSPTPSSISHLTLQSSTPHAPSKASPSATASLSPDDTLSQSGFASSQTSAAAALTHAAHGCSHCIY